MKGTGTRRKILHSSLCRKVNLRIPEGWGQLTQEELREVLRLYTLLGEKGMDSVKSAFLCSANNMTVVRKTDIGWLCTIGKDKFILNTELLPDIFSHMEWIDHPEQMTDRLQHVGKYEARDMWLRTLPFGHYLMLENFYQAFLASEDPSLLGRMARVLYNVPDDAKDFHPEPYELNATFMWYTAVKRRFAEEFPNFLKPAAGQETGTAASQKDIMAAQIRILTKGDITKNDAILKSDTWSALLELDALAKEAEEFKNKMKKK